MQRIGFVGIGLMGQQMARRILEAGLSPHGLEPHEREGGASDLRRRDMGGFAQGRGPGLRRRDHDGHRLGGFRSR